MAMFVAVHGAWSAAWAWRKMRGRLRRRGHDLATPTLTGLGDRSHLLTPAVDLSLHIADVAAFLTYEDLDEVILIGHSYGGMVATGVANRLPDRIKTLVYLDAFVPKNGDCVFDLLPAAVAARMIEAADRDGDGWLLPPNPLPPDTAPDDAAWILERRGPQPIGTHREPVLLDPAVPWPPRWFIRCSRAGPHDVFRRFAEACRHEAGWQSRELEASHSPHITAPDALSDLLHEIAQASG